MHGQPWVPVPRSLFAGVDNHYFPDKDATRPASAGRNSMRANDATGGGFVQRASRMSTSFSTNFHSSVVRNSATRSSKADAFSGA